jgi:hypothetical protein
MSEEPDSTQSKYLDARTIEGHRKKNNQCKGRGGGQEREDSESGAGELCFHRTNKRTKRKRTQKLPMGEDTVSKARGGDGFTRRDCTTI